jgi:hypothetical protein
MKNNHLKHKYLLTHKDEIIEMYRNDTPVKDILKKYGIGHDCLRVNLRSWGILKRFNYGVEMEKNTTSLNLLEKRKVNSMINHAKVKRIFSYDSPEDQKLVHQILQMAIIG